MPAILLGGRGSTLSVARRLARYGIEVYVLADPASEVRFSRFCTHFVGMRAADVQGAWLEWLEERGPREAVVLTCHDDGLELVAKHRGRLERRGYRPFEADDDLLLAMLDKGRTHELATQVGVPTPRSWLVRSAADVGAAAGDVDYPCALKPRHSHLFVPRFGVKLLVAHNRDELLSQFDRVLAVGAEVIVTEIVPGGDDQSFSYYTYLDDGGQPLFHLTKQKLRQFPNHFGLGSYHITDWRPDVAELGLRLVQGIGLRGLVNPEFKRDPRDGKLKLMEVNHRFTAINELLQAAGIDVALLAYNRAAGVPPPPLDGYRRGVRILDPLHDTRAFLQYRREGQLTTGAWLRSLAHRQRFPRFAVSDPLPSVAYHLAAAVRGLNMRRAGRGPGYDDHGR